MKFLRRGEEVWKLLWSTSIEIAENIGIEVTIEKRKEFLPKVAGDMSKDQRPENVQMSKDQRPENVQMSRDQRSENIQ